MYQLPKIIYIAGYGRSGSTILDILLGDHPQIFSGGELIYLLEDFMNTNRKCTCGNLYPQCPVWKDLPGRLPCSIDDCVKILRSVDQRKRLSGGQIKTKQKQKEMYAAINEAIFRQASNNNSYKFVVDSSKTAGDASLRPIALARVAGLDVKVIHLKRSFLKTMKSVFRKGNWESEGYRRKRFRRTRAIAGWMLANNFASQTKRFLGSNNYFYLHYRDLVIDPMESLLHIGIFLKVDLTEIGRKAESGGAFIPRHNAGGNRARLQNKIILNKA